MLVQCSAKQERRRLDELTAILEEVVEIFGPIRRGATEGETGFKAEIELKHLRESLKN